jgi:hemerythrin-like domain-containing protein
MEPSTEVSSPTLREHFLADHRRLDALFERLLDAFEADDQIEIRRLWGLLEPTLLAHLEAEEQHLMPAFNRVAEQSARELLAEHEDLRKRVADLGAALDIHIVRLEAARAFIEVLREHARKEDALLYRWADENVDASKKARLLERLMSSSYEPAGRAHGLA